MENKVCNECYDWEGNEEYEEVLEDKNDEYLSLTILMNRKELRIKAKNVESYEEIKELVPLAGEILKKGGYALSFNQLRLYNSATDENKRLGLNAFIFNEKLAEKFGEKVIINPVVVGNENIGFFKSNESCLSIEGVRKEIKRFQTIDIAYTDKNWERKYCQIGMNYIQWYDKNGNMIKEIKYDVGVKQEYRKYRFLEVLQHEYDHSLGLLIIYK